MNRRNAYLITAALALFSAGPAFSAPAVDHNREFQACLTLAEKRPAEALESAQTWLNRGGGDHARLCQALALFHKGDFTTAGARLEELAPVLGKDDPKAGASILGRAGWAWLRAGDNVRAERAYSRALALQPDDVDLLIDRAIARAETERFWDAVADLDAALKKDPRRPEAYLYRAAAHKALANDRQAVADIDRALELRPGDPDALLLRATIKAQAGQSAGRAGGLEPDRSQHAEQRGGEDGAGQPRPLRQGAGSRRQGRREGTGTRKTIIAIWSLRSFYKAPATFSRLDGCERFAGSSAAKRGGQERAPHLPVRSGAAMSGHPTPETGQSPGGRHLGELKKGERARVTGVDERGVVTTLPEGELERRMIEMGLVEGSHVEVLHEAFPGRDPIAIRVNEHTLALRRAEARAVLVAPAA
ncbi:FeoA family protein [Azospirillum baldaniorum]|uniref:Ferrous iron transporter FeoA-like domain-containing protein n=1 Tax=Azospirillum baldaniorum TaxID=1064539 RepID=A0A9P1JUX0_9PROT|nr:FeoA family protein [Azospirillum baldaniorum]CCD00281.1 conserved exported protein of unknown function [Azospirillum baldaniorum]